MLKNPYGNAMLAAGYIVLLVSMMWTFVDGPDESTIIMPMVMLSLLVLSVATMGFLFFAQPLRMFVEGRKDEAVTFFLKTLGTFAALVLVFLLLLLM